MENEGAKIYKTINCLGLGVDESLEKIASVISTIPEDSFVRIEADKDDPIIISLDILKGKYPNIVWSTKISTKTNTGKEMLVDMRAKYRGLDITKDNLFGLLMDRIKNKGLDSTVYSHCSNLLEEVIANV